MLWSWTHMQPQAVGHFFRISALHSPILQVSHGSSILQIPSLMEGGTSWFTDLTVADTTFLLPAMAFGVFLLSAELGGADGMQGQPPHVIQRFKWTMRVLTVIMVPFSKGLPAVSAAWRGQPIPLRSKHCLAMPVAVTCIICCAHVFL